MLFSKTDHFGYGVLALTLTVALSSAFDAVTSAQYPTIIGPESIGTMLDSPEVGPRKGIQTFGQRLLTDPDPGIGFTYRVFPSQQNSPLTDQQSLLWVLAHTPEALTLKQRYQSLGHKLEQRARPGIEPDEFNKLTEEIRQIEVEISQLQLGLQLAFGTSNAPASRYASPRNSLDGLRRPFDSKTRALSATNTGATGLVSAASGTVGARGIGVDGNLIVGNAEKNVELFNQPLIQIKVRIIEATRLNAADFSSVLDYISREGPGSFIDANNVNGNRQSTRGATRFATPNRTIRPDQTQAAQIGSFTNISGSGALINLTTEHLNLITNALVTDFRGDVLNVPEVVTLNGQLVEFIAGDNRALPLGLTLVQSDGRAVQEVFYKHIGTLLRITPRIVNWGKFAQGKGEAPIIAQEVVDWNRLAVWMSNRDNLVVSDELRELIRPLTDTALPLPASISVKREVLKTLEQYDPKSLRERLRVAADPDNPILREDVAGCGCDWKPEDCTIDLEVEVKESDLNASSSESINSIANVVQVKSGHGVVMGGLIGSRQTESVSKVPLLGDLPIAGYLFRSKTVDRAKTELIILVEATVLPNTNNLPSLTSQDFRLAQDYVDGSVRDSALECGLFRAGLAPFIPPPCLDEEFYWQQHAVNVRKVVTEVNDIVP